MNYYTVNQIKDMFCPPNEVVDVRQENNYVVIELGESEDHPYMKNGLFNLRVKIKNF